MKKVAKKTIKREVSNDDLAVMISNGFSSFEERINIRFERIENNVKDVQKIMATKADILDLHDKFIHRREFDQLSLRVSKLEEKARK